MPISHGSCLSFSASRQFWTCKPKALTVLRFQARGNKPSHRLIADNGTAGSIHDEPDVSFDAADFDIGFVSSKDTAGFVVVMINKRFDTDSGSLAVVGDLLVGNADGKTIPEDTICPLCGAPHHFLYDNNGGNGQYQCKVCGQTKGLIRTAAVLQ